MKTTTLAGDAYATSPPTCAVSILLLRVGLLICFLPAFLDLDLFFCGGVAHVAGPVVSSATSAVIAFAGSGFSTAHLVLVSALVGVGVTTAAVALSEFLDGMFC